MRKLFTILAASLFLSTATVQIADACEGHDKPASAKKKETPKNVASASFKVEGMDCDGCAGKVEKSLAKAEGIVAVEVSVAAKRVTVKYDADKLNVAKVAKLISDLGYKATAEA